MLHLKVSARFASILPTLTFLIEVSSLVVIKVQSSSLKVPPGPVPPRVTDLPLQALQAFGQFDNIQTALVSHSRIVAQNPQRRCLSIQVVTPLQTSQDTGQWSSIQFLFVLHSPMDDQNLQRS